MASKLLLSPDKESVFCSQPVDLGPHGASNEFWNPETRVTNSGAYRARRVIMREGVGGRMANQKSHSPMQECGSNVARSSDFLEESPNSRFLCEPLKFLNVGYDYWSFQNAVRANQKMSSGKIGPSEP